MLTKLNYTVPFEMIQEASMSTRSDEFRSSINEPTGDFFYDPWKIKSEFKGTIWEKILLTLPLEIGEARIIVLGHGVCYQSHGDIDDRYHLNITGQYSYLINLETNTMYPLFTDGVWYEMDAGPRHSAANFGYINRVQLVVRKLLNKNKLINPVNIKMFYAGKDKDSVRFTFDDAISPWLNNANKRGVITDFVANHSDVQFKIEQTEIQELEKILPIDFKIEII